MSSVIWVLLAISAAYDSHGRPAGLTRDHVMTFASSDTCNAARVSMAKFDRDVIFTCQREPVAGIR